MSQAHAPGPAAPEPHVVLVYADDPQVRERVRTAVGRRPAPDLGRIEWVEAASGPDAITVLDNGGVDLAILDGEAWPTGGLGLARQVKDELVDCPPVLVLIARRDDRWLATWSQADGVAMHPIDPGLLVDEVTRLLREREAGLPVRRVDRLTGSTGR